MKLKALCVLVFSAALTACATVEQYKEIPLTDQEFAKPIEEIRTRFSDVPRYETFWRGFPGSLGDLHDLETKWGKADRVETRWGEHFLGTLFGVSLAVTGYLPVAAFLAIEALAIYPPEDYYWIKQDTEVRAEVFRPGVMGYEPQIRQWEWRKVADGSAKEEQITTAEHALQSD